MTKEKWREIYDKESVNASNNIYNFDTVIPENWNKNKKVYLNFIKQMDEATEVYFMENKKD